MRWRRVRSVVLHSWHHLTHSMETWVDIFWFPIIQTAVFAAIGVYFAQQSGADAAQYVVVGILLWYGMEAGSYAIAVGMLWEVWARNFSTLFASPLKLEEFIAGQIIFGLVKQLLTVATLSLVAYGVFHFSIFAIGISLPVHLLLLMAFGWVVGMVALGLVLRFGTRIQSVAWGLIYIIQPIVGAFYPVSVLPVWVQRIAFAIPPTYVFESARTAIRTGLPRWDYLIYAALLTCVYMFFGYLFMRWTWEYARRAGTLAQMEG